VLVVLYVTCRKEKRSSLIYASVKAKRLESQTKSNAIFRVQDLLCTCGWQMRVSIGVWWTIQLQF